MGLENKKEFLTLEIDYDSKTGLAKISGDVKESEQKDLLVEFLRLQIGESRDERKPEKRDNYNICLKWYPRDDSFKISSNCGNFGLRDGIIIDVIKKNYK